MGLRFGFVLETALITKGCFTYCWAVFICTACLSWALFFSLFFSFSLSFFNYSTVFISIHNSFHVYTSESMPHLTSSLFILHEEKNKNGRGSTRGEAAGLAGSSLLLEMLLGPFLCKGGISQSKVQHPGLSLLICQILLSPCWITYSTQLESVTKVLISKKLCIHKDCKAEYQKLFILWSGWFINLDSGDQYSPPWT